MEGGSAVSVQLGGWDALRKGAALCTPPKTQDEECGAGLWGRGVLYPAQPVPSGAPAAGTTVAELQEVPGTELPVSGGEVAKPEKTAEGSKFCVQQCIPGDLIGGREIHDT